MIQILAGSMAAAPLLLAVSQRVAMKIEQKKRAHLEAMVLAEAGRIVSEELESIPTLEEE